MIDATDLPWAVDAIPKDAISLTNAYNRAVNAIINHPDLLPKFEKHWSEALQKSREAEIKFEHDPSAFDKELEEEWHHRKEANLLLRLEIEAQKLVACTRDPVVGQTLQLHSDNWIPMDWDDYVPPGIWIDYIVPDDYEAPGPAGTFIHGALRPVFFLRDEFELWFRGIFADVEPIDSSPPMNPRLLEFRSTHGKLGAAKEAVLAIWGEHGPPPGVTEKMRYREINKWLASNNRAETSMPTIRRALNEMRTERS